MSVEGEVQRWTWGMRVGGGAGGKRHQGSTYRLRNVPKINITTFFSRWRHWKQDIKANPT